jgi:hypothetical protein
MSFVLGILIPLWYLVAIALAVLKIPKGESESVNRRIDKAMAKGVKIPKGNQNP